MHLGKLHRSSPAGAQSGHEVYS